MKKRIRCIKIDAKTRRVISTYVHKEDVKDGNVFIIDENNILITDGYDDITDDSQCFFYKKKFIGINRAIIIGTDRRGWCGKYDSYYKVSTTVSVNDIVNDIEFMNFIDAYSSYAENKIEQPYTSVNLYKDSNDSSINEEYKKSFIESRRIANMDFREYMNSIK